MSGLLTDWLDWSGTTGRGQFALVSLVLMSVAVLGIAELGLVRTEPQRTALVVAVGALGIVWVGFAVRRLHDMGRNGWWTVLAVFTGLGFLLMAWLLLAPSRPDRTYRRSHPALVRLGASVLCLFAVLVVGRIFYAPYWIPSGTMKPTLSVGDFLVIKRGGGTPEQGEIVVFTHPTNGTDFIKRVIGLPGDNVQMRDGVPVVNGTPAVQTPIGSFEEAFERQGPLGTLPRCANAPDVGATCVKERFTENLASAGPYDVLNIGQGAGDFTLVFTVPDGHIFVLGDNRDNSSGSRFSAAIGGPGFVPMDNVIGRPTLILFSSAGRHLAYVWTWRPDRFFRRVG